MSLSWSTAIHNFKTESKLLYFSVTYFQCQFSLHTTSGVGNFSHSCLGRTTNLQESFQWYVIYCFRYVYTWLFKSCLVSKLSTVLHFCNKEVMPEEYLF